MKRAMRTAFATMLTLLGLASLCLADVSLPDGLKDIPLFEGSKVISAMSQADAQVVTIEANGDHKKIKEFYKTTLPKAGWKVEMEMENNDMAVLSLAKDEWRLMVTANKTGEGQVAYSIARSKD